MTETNRLFKIAYTASSRNKKAATAFYRLLVGLYKDSALPYYIKGITLLIHERNFDEGYGFLLKAFRLQATTYIRGRLALDISAILLSIAGRKETETEDKRKILINSCGFFIEACQVGSLRHKRYRRLVRLLSSRYITPSLKWRLIFSILLADLRLIWRILRFSKK